MKLMQLQLPGGAGVAAPMERLPLPFSPTELIWRYPLPFALPPASPLADVKPAMPASLAADPRVWPREDVAVFLKWCEREFDLPSFDMDMFQMNGKALCLLTKTDLGERCPGAGDVMHNVLQMLIRDASALRAALPASPVTPTSRLAYPLSPHSHPPTPSWGMLTHPGSESAFQHNIAHFVNQGNSVTLSPAPSVDSQNGSPQHPQHVETLAQTNFGHHSIFGTSSGSNHSDSDEDSYENKCGSAGTPPATPSYLTAPAPPPHSPKDQNSPSTVHRPQPQSFRPVAREFFPSDMPEPNTNGRLLWDFLQQLLNDPTQRYTNYIAWKNHETGVFKIVDPPGLAKLWGIQKNHLSMNYDKMSRALRYYYRVNILRKVQGERHCYQFLRNPTELKNIKNISLLRQQMSPTRINVSPSSAQPAPMSLSIKAEPEPEEEASHQGMLPPRHVPEDEMPTDLSMSSQDSRKRHHPEVHKPIPLSDHHRMSLIIEENLQKLNREREQHWNATVHLKSENSEH